MKEKLLLIAEKPSLMRELKEVYTNHKNEINYDIDFMALAGHVCMYGNPNDYEQWNKKWVELDSYLPMVPEKWKINVMPDKKSLYLSIKEQIEKNNYDGLICATDADREGNLIFYLLEAKLNKKLKTYRFWVNDLTERAILKSYHNMGDLHKDKFQQDLTYASILRSRFDWLVGMNISVAATLKSNMLMKIGRVKTPTLKLVYDNSKAIDEFVPKTTFGVICSYKQGFTGTLINENGEVSFEKEQDAKDLISKLKDTAKIKSIEKRIVKTNAPALFKLSDLQVFANKSNGYSAEKTLELVQSLYEKKIVSYPRCDCRVISTETTKDFPQMLRAVGAIPELAQYIPTINSNAFAAVAKSKKYVDDAEVNKSSHTALVPTGIIPKLESLTSDEKAILKIIFTRFLSIFLPPLEEEKTILLAENNGYTFKSNGKAVLNKGYTVLLNKNSEDNIIPTGLKENQILGVAKLSPNKKVTTPPARLTQGELVALMENINRLIENTELKAIMKEAKGIGTPSSRGSIISSLIKDGYIDVKKSKKTEQLYISEKGKQYIENLDGFEVVSPELTAEWEGKLKKVEHGEMNSKQFSDEMLAFLKSNIKKIKETQMSRVLNGKASENRPVIGKCPRCGKDVIETEKAFSCTGWKAEPQCRFSIWKNNKFLAASKKKLTAAKVKKLLSDGFYFEKGLTSKSGKKYDAKIQMEDTGEFIILKPVFGKDGDSK